MTTMAVALDRNLFLAYYSSITDLLSIIVSVHNVFEVFNTTALTITESDILQRRTLHSKKKNDLTIKDDTIKYSLR